MSNDHLPAEEGFDLRAIKARIEQTHVHAPFDTPKLAQLVKDRVDLVARLEAQEKLLNDLADCYFFRKSEGLLEIMRKIDRHTCNGAL